LTFSYKSEKKLSVNLTRTQLILIAFLMPACFVKNTYYFNCYHQMAAFGMFKGGNW